MDSQEVYELDSQEALNHISEAMKDLLGFKRSLKLVSEIKDDENTNQYQAALQKLEGEIRNHIKIEHQLRLYIEHTQQKFDESEKNLIQTEKQLQDKIFAYERERTVLEQTLKARVEELQRLKEGAKFSDRDISSPDSHVLTHELSTLKLNTDREALRLIKLEKRSEKLEKEWADLKKAFLSKEKELRELRRESEEIKSILSNKCYVPDPSPPTSEFYRRKYEEKYLSVLEMERKIKNLQQSSRKKSNSLSNFKTSTHRSLSQLLASSRSRSHRTLDVSVRDTSTTLSSNRSRAAIEKHNFTDKLAARSSSRRLVRNNSSKLSRTARR